MGEENLEDSPIKWCKNGDSASPVLAMSGKTRRISKVFKLGKVRFFCKKILTWSRNVLTTPRDVA